MRKPKCKLGQHKDRRMRGGKRVECEVCGDTFPCAHDCSHLDCNLEKQQPGSIIQDELGFQ